MHSYSPEVKLVFILCLPAKQLTLYGSVDRWIDDRQTEGWISYACNSRPNLYLCLLCSVPLDFGLHWLINGSKKPLQLFFSERNKGRRLEGAKRVIWEYLYPCLPNCRDSEVWLSLLTKGLSSFRSQPYQQNFFVNSFQ